VEFIQTLNLAMLYVQTPVMTMSADGAQYRTVNCLANTWQLTVHQEA